MLDRLRNWYESLWMSPPEEVRLAALTPEQSAHEIELLRMICEMHYRGVPVADIQELVDQLALESTKVLVRAHLNPE